MCLDQIGKDERMSKDERASKHFQIIVTSFFILPLCFLCNTGWNLATAMAGLTSLEDPPSSFVSFEISSILPSISDTWYNMYLLLLFWVICSPFGSWPSKIQLNHLPPDLSWWQIEPWEKSLYQKEKSNAQSTTLLSLPLWRSETLLMKKTQKTFVQNLQDRDQSKNACKTPWAGSQVW